MSKPFSVLSFASLALVALVAALLAPALAFASDTGQAIAAKAEPSVVFIVSTLESDDPSDKSVAISGTGFVVNNGGDVVTNDHVVNEIPPGSHVVAREVFAFGAGPGDGKPFTVVWSSPEKDFAVIHVEGFGRPSLTLAKREAEKGEQVWALGFPGDAQAQLAGASLTGGIVERVVLDSPSIVIIQHQATINPGNSGGPLLNACGEVVGVNSFTSAKGANLNFSRGVSSLAESLSREGIPVVAASRDCTGPSGGGDRALLFAVAFLALAALVLSLRRPRQQLVQAVERMSRRYGAPPDPNPAPRPPPAPVPDGGGGWVLVGFDSAGHTLRFPLDRSRLMAERHGYSIGRDPKFVDFAVDDGSVSRCHARVFLIGELLVIEDLASSQATRMDDKPLLPFTATSLVNGARIQVGETRLQLHPA